MAKKEKAKGPLCGEEIVELVWQHKVLITEVVRWGDNARDPDLDLWDERPTDIGEDEWRCPECGMTVAWSFDEVATLMKVR